jgi:Ca2+-binding EF-hand superfamily protein
MTPYMKQFNKMTSQDYEQGFEPAKLDEFYASSGNYQKSNSIMPKQVDFTFDVRFSGVEVGEETIEQVKELLDKFQSTNSKIVKPKLIRLEFEKHRLFELYPSMYSMVCWVVDANEFSGTEGMTYDEFVQYAIFFFTQRYHEEGLKYIFQLLDRQSKGWLSKEDFDEACSRAGLYVLKDKIDEVFEKAASDGERLRFSDFAFFMRKET